MLWCKLANMHTLKAVCQNESCKVCRCRIPSRVCRLPHRPSLLEHAPGMRSLGGCVLCRRQRPSAESGSRPRPCKIKGHKASCQACGAGAGRRSAAAKGTTLVLRSRRPVNRSTGPAEA